jgi:hypothetical protein
VSSLAVIWAVQDCGNKVEAVAKPAEGVRPTPAPAVSAACGCSSDCALLPNTDPAISAWWMYWHCTASALIISGVEL